MDKDKEKKEPEKKTRKDKYDAKLAINGTFEQTIMAAFVKDKKPEEKKDK